MGFKIGSTPVIIQEQKRLLNHSTNLHKACVGLSITSLALLALSGTAFVASALVFPPLIFVAVALLAAGLAVGGAGATCTIAGFVLYNKANNLGEVKPPVSLFF